jgi:NitT/TauT family transport system ATP-binding protein
VERTLDRAELGRRVQDALALVGLEKSAEDYPWQLSGGMQQRVQIARALALRPAVMLMDEPFAALDAMTKASMQDELLRVRERTGTSFVLSPTTSRRRSILATASPS